MSEILENVIAESVFSFSEIENYQFSFKAEHSTDSTTTHSTFMTSNGTRQGGILSPFLFCRYIRDLLQEIVQSGIGCNIGGIFMKILAYADNIGGQCKPFLSYLRNILIS